jgi:hypothetical protein
MEEACPESGFENRVAEFMQPEVCHFARITIDRESDHVDCRA